MLRIHAPTAVVRLLSAGCNRVHAMGSRAWQLDDHSQYQLIRHMYCWIAVLMQVGAP